MEGGIFFFRLIITTTTMGSKDTFKILKIKKKIHNIIIKQSLNRDTIIH